MSSASDFTIKDGVLKKYVGSGGDVVIPEGVTSIGWCAFSGCRSMTSVVIPDSVTSIGSGAFSGCSGLTSVTIPDGVTRIGSEAFRNCSGLTNVVIPGSVMTVESGAFPQTTTVWIEDISKLSAPLRPNAVRGFVEAGGGRETPGFDSHSKYIKNNAAKLADLAMEQPTLLALMCAEKLIAPKHVELYVEAAQKSGNAEAIAMMLDYQANKISSKQKEAVEKRKEKEQDTVVDRMLARQGKEGIAGLNIATSGNLDTFRNRDELKEFILGKKAKLASSLTAKVDYLILNDPEADSEKARKAQQLGVEIITEQRFIELAGAFSMKGTILTQYYGSGGDVVIPEGVTSIGEKAFYKFRSKIKSVTIADSVTRIGEYAFYHCSRLRKMTIPAGVTRIGKEAFSGCGLTSVTIPASVTSIGKSAFAKNPKLTIHAPAGSYAEQYAKENNIPFAAE